MYMVPNFIIIIPYRDRPIDKHIYLNYMKYILEDESNYEIYFIHQDNDLPFNRGAMKNLGFIKIKENYPDNYKHITIVFQDVDTIPYKKDLVSFTTSKGIVKHFFGFDFALGGMFCINAEDFESIGGFPNFWSWGFEDTLLNNRCVYNKIHIDRNVFFKSGSNEFMQFSIANQPQLNLKNLEKTTNNSGDTYNDIININNKNQEDYLQPIKHRIYYFDFNTTQKYNVNNEGLTDMSRKKFFFDKGNNVKVMARKKLVFF
uniref:Galactosyltransferase C-terminal domain-containing protein n=1 Tax=viral metagenome TaxID=1070528 RepID=A0A6C0C3P0_9ZZZZ